MGSQSFATPEYLRVRNGRFEGFPCSVLCCRRQRRPAGEETVQEAHSRMSLGTSETAASLQPSARSLETRRLGHLRPSVANQNASNSSLAGWLRRSLTVDLLSI